MLDRKIKDIDASVEILEDRKKISKIIFFLFFIVGWAITWLSVCLLPLKYDELGIGIGIAFLIFATWFFIDLGYYNILIFLKKHKENKQ